MTRRRLDPHRELARELVRIRGLLAVVEERAAQLQREADQARDAGVISLRSQAHQRATTGAPRDTPIEATVWSPEYRRLQGGLAVSARLAARASASLARTERALDAALLELHGRWLDTDPDLRAQRLQARIAAAERQHATGPAC